MTTRNRPIRVLQMVYYLSFGGIETWLMHVLRNIDRTRFHIDFLVHTTAPYPHDAEARALGSRIIPCVLPTRFWKYGHVLKGLLREHGPYDVVHTHVAFHGFALRYARQAGVPVRVAHSYNDAPEFRPTRYPLRRAFLALTNPWIRREATLGLAASRAAAVALFGPDWERDPRWRIHYYSIDLAPFAQTVDPQSVRREFGIAPDEFVIGHVGRFHAQKNHAFLVDIAAEVVRREPRTRFLLVGDGELRPAVMAKTARRGLADRVIFAGLRSDVVRLMLGAMDAFVLPSHYEGLPLVGLETQAAGLPAVISDSITPEVAAVPGLIRRLSLAQPPADWAEALLAIRANGAPISRQEALAVLEKGPFNIRNGVRELERLYADALAAQTAPAADTPR
jgi:glycosyltransferase involved in cell wall biosynthesis